MTSKRPKQTRICRTQHTRKALTIDIAGGLRQPNPAKLLNLWGILVGWVRNEIQLLARPAASIVLRIVLKGKIYGIRYKNNEASPTAGDGGLGGSACA